MRKKFFFIKKIKNLIHIADGSVEWKIRGEKKCLNE